MTEDEEPDLLLAENFKGVTLKSDETIVVVNELDLATGDWFVTIEIWKGGKLVDRGKKHLLL